MNKPFNSDGVFHPDHAKHALRSFITRLETIAAHPDEFSEADHAWAKENAHLIELEAEAAPRFQPVPRPSLARRFSRML